MLTTMYSSVMMILENINIKSAKMEVVLYELHQQTKSVPILQSKRC